MAESLNRLDVGPSRGLPSARGPALQLCPAPVCALHRWLSRAHDINRARLLRGSDKSQRISRLPGRSCPGHTRQQKLLYKLQGPRRSCASMDSKEADDWTNRAFRWTVGPRNLG
eukprot:15730785-Heterocapsa_arctica.AAC.1